VIAGRRPSLRHLLAASTACAALLHSASYTALALASESKPRASAVSTSRWWKLDCGEAPGASAGNRTSCAFTVKIRGVLDSSRLQLIRHALVRRDAARRALHRDVDLRIDVDSQGGEVFAAMQIGRILREERASIAIRNGASCISSCVLLLMGAVERNVSEAARLGIHRPSLGASGRGGPKETGEDAVVDALAAQLALYAEQMNVPRKIVDEMMSIPADRLRLLKPSDLAGYGIFASDTIAR